jgi:hypothetical protein
MNLQNKILASEYTGWEMVHPVKMEMSFLARVFIEGVYHYYRARYAP